MRLILIGLIQINLISIKLIETTKIKKYLPKKTNCQIQQNFGCRLLGFGPIKQTNKLGDKFNHWLTVF